MQSQFTWMNGELVPGAQLMDACRETVRANGFDECYIRPRVFLAQGGWNLNKVAEG
jgi:branched-subunit amino acid aminotransferase/4-amino-4-deoxychorismate lyase